MSVQATRVNAAAPGVQSTPLDPAPTAAEMVRILMAALRDNPAAVFSVTVDGQIVQYGRQQAIEELKFWQKQAAIASGRRQRASGISLSGGYQTNGGFYP